MTVDVRALARPELPAPRRRPLTRYVLPAVLLAGFAGAVAWSARESLLPGTPVTVVPVLAARSEVQATDAPLFAAAGWIEPRPTPLFVSALTEGVVESLLVVEGQDVAAGEPVAHLIAADAKLALREAEANRTVREAERQAAVAALDAARVSLAEPLDRQAALAEVEAALAKSDADLARLPHQTDAAEARRALAEQDWKAKSSGGSLTPLAVARAKAELDAAEAAVKELQAQRPALQQQRDADARRRDALKRQLELKVAEARQFAEAGANVAIADARLRLAAVAVETAQLRLDRTAVRAPAAGKVLALVARPGSKVMGSAVGGHDAAVVVTLYRPESLQVRADVRLENVPGVHVGQTVRVETAAVNGAMTGRVLAVTSAADIQKNTLQVKVALDAPPPVLKPDMLAQVTFLAPPRPAGASGRTEPLRLLIPRTLVQGEASSARVWVADRAAGVARLRAVSLGGVAGELVEVTEGLSVGDRLIVGGRESLTEGQRVRVTGE